MSPMVTSIFCTASWLCAHSTHESTSASPQSSTPSNQFPTVSIQHPLLVIDSPLIEIDSLLQVIDFALSVIDSPLLITKLLLVTEGSFCCETSPALDFSFRGAAHTLGFTVSDKGISGGGLGSFAHTPSLSPHSRRLQMEPLSSDQGTT